MHFPVLKRNWYICLIKHTCVPKNINLSISSLQEWLSGYTYLDHFSPPERMAKLPLNPQERMPRSAFSHLCKNLTWGTNISIHKKIWLNLFSMIWLRVNMLTLWHMHFNPQYCFAEGFVILQFSSQKSEMQHKYFYFHENISFKPHAVKYISLSAIINTISR